MTTNHGGQNWTLAKWRGPSPPDGLRREQEHRIATLARQEDFDCYVLGKMGIGVKAIAAYTHLSESQVRTRLTKHRVRIKDYREGRGPYARMVFQGLARRAAEQAVWEVRHLIEG